MQEPIYHRSAVASTNLSAADLAARLDLRRSRRGEWRGNCPCCAYADAAVLSERAGRPLLWCASCQDRAGLAAVMRQAAGGAVPSTSAESRASDGERRAARAERARGIWSGAEQITADSPAGLYLAHRRIEHVMQSVALRWRSDVPHPAGGRRLALLARVDDAGGKFSGVQRIYIDRDGRKADVEPAKASLGSIAGGAVRLQEATDSLVVAEGFETAAAAGLLIGLPAWAAISCGNMAKSLALPAEVRIITICADHDAPGLRAAEDAARRWRDEGRAVRIIRARKAGADAADILAGGAP